MSPRSLVVVVPKFHTTKRGVLIEKNECLGNICKTQFCNAKHNGNQGGLELSSTARNASSSVRRALSILFFLAENANERGWALSELADALEMNKSTLLRLLAPLRDFDLIYQDRETIRYRLGPGTLRLAQGFEAGTQLQKLAAPYLQALMEQSGETVHLVIYDNGEVIYIDKYETPSTVRMYSRVGGRMPAHCTGVGKAFLAHLPESELAKVIARGLTPRTPNTITNADELRRDLEAIRQRGYSIDDIENEPEVRCVGAPVFDHTGSVVAAISIAGPASRVTEARLSELGRRVKETAEQISGLLGFRDSGLAD